MPSLGVSSLDLGRLLQNRWLFFALFCSFGGKFIGRVCAVEHMGKLADHLCQFKAYGLKMDPFSKVCSFI